MVPRCQGAVRITEVNFHIRGYREGFVFRHLQPAIPRQRSPQRCWKPANLPAPCSDDRGGVFASHLDQGSKTRMPLHQRRDVTVFCATNEIAFPMTGNSSVLDFCGPLPDGDGIGRTSCTRACSTHSYRAERRPATDLESKRARAPRYRKRCSWFKQANPGRPQRSRRFWAALIAELRPHGWVKVGRHFEKVK